MLSFLKKLFRLQEDEEIDVYQPTQLESLAFNKFCDFTEADPFFYLIKGCHTIPVKIKVRKNNGTFDYVTVTLAMEIGALYAFWQEYQSGMRMDIGEDIDDMFERLMSLRKYVKW
jgi:hypothetical protein